jgi:hypothetical protein
MAEDLDAEGERLRQRLAVLERQHGAVHGRPHDLKAHEAHRMDLVDYQADVRAYRERLTAARLTRTGPRLTEP